MESLICPLALLMGGRSHHADVNGSFGDQNTGETTRQMSLISTKVT